MGSDLKLKRLATINEDDFTKLLHEVGDSRMQDFLQSILIGFVEEPSAYFIIGENYNDMEANQRIYEFMNDASLEEYMDEVCNDTSYIGEMLCDEFADECEELEIDTSDTDTIGNDAYIYATEHCFGQLENEWEEARNRFMIQNDQMPGFNSAGTYLEEQTDTSYDDIGDEADENEYNEIDTADELLDLDDRIGCTTRMNDTIDYDNRDNAFVYIDGQILEGDHGETHSQIVNHYLRDEGKQTITDDYDTRFTNSRPTVKQVQRSLNAEVVAFGHFYNDMAFVENTIGCDVQEVKQALQQDYDCAKIYHYIRNGNGEFVTRIASKHNKLRAICVQI